MMAGASVKRNDLSLEQKYQVIKASKITPKLGIRKIAEQFKCGKTQISSILKNESRIVEMYEANASGNTC